MKETDTSMGQFRTTLHSCLESLSRGFVHFPEELGRPISYLVVKLDCKYTHTVQIVHLAIIKRHFQCPAAVVT